MRRPIERMWIVWESQRRSVELGGRLGCSFHVYDIRGLRRYPLSIAGTLSLLVRFRPRCLFVQNPSMILAAIACVYGVLSGNVVVVDRHTSFPHLSKIPYLAHPRPLSVRRHVFNLLHRFTLRTADLTIVTTSYLAELVREAGGRPFVLPDPIPALARRAVPQLQGRKNVLVISSFVEDEPIAEVLGAARHLDDPSVRIYFSGNHRKGDVDWTAQAPPNVVFTGFLSSADFVDLLFAVDAVVVLTTVDHCLLCGCYEAVAADKPLITSDTTALREYFHGAEFVEAQAESILGGLRRVLHDLETYRARTEEMRAKLGADWERAFNDLEREIAGARRR